MILLHGPDLRVPAGALDALDVELRVIRSLARSGAVGDSEEEAALAVVVLDAGLAAALGLDEGRDPRAGGSAEGAGDPPGDGLDELLGALPASAVVLAADVSIAPHDERVWLTLPGAEDGAGWNRVLRAAYEHAAARSEAARAGKELARARSELHDLTRIGMALMTERDLDRLLVEILERAQRLTDSDAGSIYLIERDESGRDARLRFELMRNDSLPELRTEQFSLPLDTASLAGYVAVTGETLVLDDAYQAPAGAPYSFNRAIDERIGYSTRSVLVVPMIDYRDRVVGVIQLINRKRDPSARIRSAADADRHVLGYDEARLRLVRSLAGQAAVAIESSRLQREIERIFESFVKASVIAIDQRDPTTAGHSVRVATLTCAMAEALADHDRGRYAGFRFSPEQMRELRYAALLHDFGKVGVREEVLVKARKLPPRLEERVHARFRLIRRTLEAEHHRRRAEALERAGPEAAAERLAELDREHRERMDEVERFHAVVDAANRPTPLDPDHAAALGDIARRTFTDVDGELVPYLTEEELGYLTIPRGTLDDRERLEIESHVEQTYRFLSQIPWTDELSDVAHIAYGHHEKLDGGGYPRGLRADEIPVQTRIMTIADIFDALTASDRPYKAAVPTDRALDILRAEASRGLLDADLVELLIESELYRIILERDWREL